MRKMLVVLAIMLVIILLVPAVSFAGGRGGYGHGGHRGGHSFGGAFWGTALGLIAVGTVYNALTPRYVYPQPAYDSYNYAPAPPPVYRSTYRQLKYRQPMCSEFVRTGYWTEDECGNRHWVQTGADRKLIVPCD